MTNRITANDAPWLASKGFLELNGKVLERGGSLRAIGGPVRDALLPRGEIDDLDLAASLDRSDWEAIAGELGYKWYAHPFRDDTVFVDRSRSLGIEHHMSVSFIGRHPGAWEVDATGRDFTVNTLSCDGDGIVHDPLGTGLDDLAGRNVRLAGADSFTSDPVRLLRYPRMHSILGEAVPDPATLAAATAASPLLKGAEPVRVMLEMIKLMAYVDDEGALARLALLDGIGALRVACPNADLARLARFQDILSSDGRLGTVHEASMHEMVRLAVLAAAPSGSGFRFDSIAAWQDDRDLFFTDCMLALSGNVERHELPGGSFFRDRVLKALAEVGQPIPAREAGMTL